MSSWRDRRVPEFQQYLRSVLGREPTERDYAAAIMQLEQRGAGSVAVGHAFHNRLATEGGDPTRHLRHYDPVALGHRWHEVTPQAIDKWAAEYDRIASGSGPLQAGQTHFFSPAGMQAYYNKDPSMVRSAVRMTVPGYGEVLVPNWATRAVADGNFTNVNGEWFLTPNERYGKEPAPVRVASQDAEAQPGGFYGNPVPASPTPASAPATYAVASSAPDASTAVPKPSASESMFGGDAVSKAMRIASLISPKSSPQREDEGIKFEPLRHDHRPLGDASGGLQMAAASVPYLKRADGGEVKYPEGGAGRFASPVSLVATQADKDRGNDTALVGRMMDRMTGVGRMTYAKGGSVDDTGVTMPETPESLLAQQRQLIEGRRIAQMFPAGTEELPLPPGMERVETPRGVFHFDPMRISAREVVEASNSRRENEVLGLGPMSKDDVARIMQQTGEEPVSIVERDPMGNEVRGSLATPSTIDVQADTILRTADPKHVVDVEPVEDVIAQRAMRIARADGGEIPFASDMDDATWHPRSVNQRYADAYDPTFRDRLANFVREKMFGSDNRDPSVNRFVSGLVGSDGLSRDGFSAAALSPPVLAVDGSINVAESLMRGNLPRAAINAAETAIPMVAANYAGRFLGNVDRKAEAMAAGSDRWSRDIGKGNTVRSEPTPGSTGSLAEQGFSGEVIAARSAQPQSRPRVDREAQYQADIAELEARRLARIAQEEASAARGIAPRSAADEGRLIINREPSEVIAAREAGGPEMAPPPEWYRGVREFWDMKKPDKLHADGGRVEEYAAGGGIGAKPFTGALYGATGGRADKLPGTARSGSHVIPADIVSHMGQGNTNAGLKIMDRMFGTGPYGMSLSRRRRADGGAVDQEIPVALSDGEYVIEPEVVASLGNGDIEVGHDVLDAWIMQERQNAINTLASLPPPATD